MVERLRDIWHDLRGIVADQLLFFALRVAPPDAQVPMGKAIVLYGAEMERKFKEAGDV